jgi:predicted nucleotidyltransferase
VLSNADIHWMVQEIVEACRPSQIYVFGSYALGTAHARSDLDFLIVQDSRLPRHRRGAGIRARLARIAVDVDLVFVTPGELRDELTRASSIVSAIFPSARLVYPSENSVPGDFFRQRLDEG